MRIGWITAKYLKKLVGEKLPDPKSKEWHYSVASVYEGIVRDKRKYEACFLSPAYMFHDLVDRPFCKALAAARWQKVGRPMSWREISVDLYSAFVDDGGMPAVEKKLMELVGAK